MKIYMKNLIKVLLRYLPTNKLWIMFESHSDFCDNSRALFEYMYEREIYKKYKFIWLVDNKDKFKDKYYKNTKFININPTRIDEKIRLYLYIIFSKYVFFSHRPIGGFSKFQTRINLWHGTPLKRIKGKVPDGTTFDYILAPSKYYSDIYIDQFKCDESQLLYLGYPRNDLLFKNTNYIKDIVGYIPNKFIIWMPTFRQHKNMKRIDSNLNLKYGIPIIDTKEKLLELDKFLNTKDIFILVKLHPAQNLSGIESIELYNIKVITNEDLENKNIDLYSLVGESNALITDYSSIYFDYLILNNPIAFTIDDHESYLNNTGFVFDNIDDFMPGMYINNIQDIKLFINSIDKEDIYEKERKRINNKVNIYCDEFSSKRIVERFKL